jgi:hypothetical protein
LSFSTLITPSLSKNSVQLGLISDKLNDKMMFLK